MIWMWGAGEELSRLLGPCLGDRGAGAVGPWGATSSGVGRSRFLLGVGRRGHGFRVAHVESEGPVSPEASLLHVQTAASLLCPTQHLFALQTYPWVSSCYKGTRPTGLGPCPYNLT